MDFVLYYADEFVLDGAYGLIRDSLIHLTKPLLETLPSQGLVNETRLASMIISAFARDQIWRQFTSLTLIATVFGFLLYFSVAAPSYFFIYDHAQMNHPRFLKNQIRREITLSCSSFFTMSLMTAFFFLGEIHGYSRMYEGPAEYGWAYLIASIPLFIFLTDFGVYWIHRGLHHRLVYARLHKPHHQWIIPTPFASHAFHPLDGFLQSTPYHIFVYLLPMNKFLYLGLFVFVNLWTVLIHDGEYMVQGPVINSSAHHAVHHLQFNYNYGQYFTLWDRVGGSYREPPKALFTRARGKVDGEVWRDQAKDVDQYDPEVVEAKGSLRHRPTLGVKAN
ncbi:hypothetical protein BJ684DRAFT_8903 [Piptocephalis cylindrospora]|uniref:Fatty acid hydroxylase domain-containing protein n=1 Tax=Piptocephalis cylindrospora TaxID=1907219 RepID=A0A4V1IYE1_9FUNG|nr:hypothetical protein BJ684DRAFT_8903 [Piptocephalis cylindrospora]|eukprot:RKP14239.1 hypothetical protein BJ684DRAFT_8903 [Piptocephalis cylindrospora]